MKVVPGAHDAFFAQDRHKPRNIIKVPDLGFRLALVARESAARLLAGRRCSKAAGPRVYGMTRDGAPLGYDRHEICVSLLKIAPSRFLVVATGLLALAIFIVDTATPFGFAVAVLYVLVILLAASFCRRRDVLLASAGCMALTVLSYFISHGTGFVEGPLARAFMSLSAIGVTTLLALRYQSAVQALRAQAALLDLTHDTVFVRDMNDVITCWNRGAEEQYGWTREEAAGRVTSETPAGALSRASGKDSCRPAAHRPVEWRARSHPARRHQGRRGEQGALDRDERSRPQTILETSNDITAEKHALKALVEAQAQLAHVTRVTTLGEMSASIAHEVNQPLAGIITNGEAGLRWLERDVPQLEEVRGAMERMIRDALIEAHGGRI